MQTSVNRQLEADEGHACPGTGEEGQPAKGRGRCGGWHRTRVVLEGGDSVPGRTSDHVGPGELYEGQKPLGRAVRMWTRCLGSSSESCPFVPSGDVQDRAQCHGTRRRSFVPGCPSRPQAQTPFPNNESLSLQLHPTALLKVGVQLRVRRAPSPLASVVGSCPAPRPAPAGQPRSLPATPFTWLAQAEFPSLASPSTPV